MPKIIPMVRPLVMNASVGEEAGHLTQCSIMLVTAIPTIPMKSTIILDSESAAQSMLQNNLFSYLSLFSCLFIFLFSLLISLRCFLFIFFAFFSAEKVSRLKFSIQEHTKTEIRHKSVAKITGQ